MGLFSKLLGRKEVKKKRGFRHVACEVCGKTATRKISGGAGLVFKGSGFYITDYGKDGKGPRKADAEKPAAESKSEPSAKADKPEAKPAPKAESKSEKPAKPVPSRSEGKAASE